MSEFVTVHLGLDGVQSGHKDVYWFWQERPYVQWVLWLLVLPYTGVLLVGVTSFRVREQILGLNMCVWCHSEVCPLCSFKESPHRCGLCLPKGRARVTFMVKKVDLEKDERER
jgi:hypothetical protein